MTQFSSKFYANSFSRGTFKAPLIANIRTSKFSFERYDLKIYEICIVVMYMRPYNWFTNTQLFRFSSLIDLELGMFIRGVNDR